MSLTWLRFLFLSSLVACAAAGGAELSQSAGSQAGASDEAAAAAPATGSLNSAETDVVMRDGYLLQAGDVLQVSVWKETELTAETLIRPDGGMSFPLAGDLQAAGHTVAELTGMLEKRIRKFEPDAVVTISVKAAIGNRVYVIGRSTSPVIFR